MSKSGFEGIREIRILIKITIFNSFGLAGKSWGPFLNVRILKKIAKLSNIIVYNVASRLRIRIAYWTKTL